VAAWGYFLLKAVYDQDGGIKALWPIFGIANQLLASIALCLATTVLLKTGLQRSPKKQPALALVALVPLAWLLTVTATAAIEKIGHSNPKIGFLAGAAATEQKLPSLEKALETAPDAAAKSKAAAALKSAKAQIFNLRLDAGITAAFLGMVAAILGISLREWGRLLSGNRSPVSSETEPVWLNPGSVRESAPFPSMGVIAIGLSLLREISGEGAIDRAETAACACQTAESQEPTKSIRRNVFLTTTDARYRGINRCC
jgi:carbon starvation protein